MRNCWSVFVLFIICFNAGAQETSRTMISLDKNWRTVADNTNRNAYAGFEAVAYNDNAWKQVDVPHNWDDYWGYRRLLHGNRHGYAWYRKSFKIGESSAGRRYFLWFEGVGSYATIWLNGKKAGYHAGGRTSFTVDITNLIKDRGAVNTLAVRADHPADIHDLPWVCGGCSDERGFSEGSQPMGIFRPVHLVVTNQVRIEPFGVHIWNDTTVSEKSARLYMETEIKNYGTRQGSYQLTNKLVDRDGKTVFSISVPRVIKAGETLVVKQNSPEIDHPHLWSPADPWLYTLVTEITENGEIIDRISTPYGIRWIKWPAPGESGKPFLINGKPFFINGIAEYEHLIGQSHAFTAQQVHARVMMVKSAGFNAFRDAHQPHNLQYQEYWDKMGLLWWPQMAAHIWFDTPEFRANFKALLKDWIKERRNSPSIILWGLENESTLPEDFARECSDLIRQLDPTASVQRKITTCNGGKGTDWDVPQNWTGTYGGNPAVYGEDLKRQELVGEYGAWRTLEMHSEGPFIQNGPVSEDRMSQLMEMKVRLADSVKSQTCGHFFWLLESHDNPGRVQGGEGLREIDRIGPVNYKGLFTPWEEPLDVYYMFRANYAPKESEPMVYIVSHTWPDRWAKPGIKDSISVYSNCDEVELFNDAGDASLGRRRRNGTGTHFQWDKVNIRYNVLYAVGYVNGKEVARDCIVLHYLPPAPHFNRLFDTSGVAITEPQKGYKYLYRVNCGGPDYKDSNGNVWMADRHFTKNSWGSVSWTDDFPGMPAFFASQRRNNNPVKGTSDWPLFQSFRYGRDKLMYKFPVPNGNYLVELYFAEPWFGTGGGQDCRGWRMFDVAVNGRTVIKDLDLWKEAGFATAIKKVVKATVTNGMLVISFPHVAAGQAVISGIAVASHNSRVKQVTEPVSLIGDLKTTGKNESGKWVKRTWLDTGDKLYTDDNREFRSLPSNLYSAEWISTPVNGTSGNCQFSVNAEADVFIAIPKQQKIPFWMEGYEDTKSSIEDNEGHILNVYRKRFKKNNLVDLGAGGSSGFPMYTVAVLPASSLQPAYDLKPVKTYKAPSAIFSKGVIKEEVNEKEAVTFKNGKGETLDWHISVGVADTYSLTIKYANNQGHNLTARIELLSADGTVMKGENVDFVPGKPGKWSYFNTNTGSMINAGSYTVRLTVVNAEGLSISGLDVQ